ncbi:MAG TPA: SCP2 sterol-binding domain-containing protein [Burkholderiaceae bacterium]
MNRGQHATIDPVSSLLALLPEYSGSLVVATGLNLALIRHLSKKMQQSIEGRKFRVKVTDSNLIFVFQWTDGAFVPLHARAHVDLTLAASSHDFLLLAQRKTNIKALLAARRLVVDGDIELGRLVKRIIEGIEGPLFDMDSLAPAQIYSTLKNAMQKHS